MVYAVIDTNIFVSALITHNSNASTARVLESLFLHRAKFKLSDDQICTVIELVKQNGIDSSRFPYDGEMPDEDDRVFYEICLSKEDSFLVTGNLKHFPKVGDTCNHTNEVVLLRAVTSFLLRVLSYVRGTEGGVKTIEGRFSKRYSLSSSG